MLIGHSFGTYVGLNTVKEYPELYHAYIAMSQLTNQRESEILAYNYMYEQYMSQGNEKMIKQFDGYPISDSEDAYNAYSMSGLRDTAMHDLGVGTTRAMRSVISEMVMAHGVSRPVRHFAKPPGVVCNLAIEVMTIELKTLKNVHFPSETT